MIRQYFRLFPKRRDQALDPIVMLVALAHDIDIRIVNRAHVIVHHDGAPDG